MVEAYRKIRNTCRFLLANLYDFDPRDAVADRQRCTKSIATRWRATRETPLRVLDAYDDYDFPTIFSALNQLTTVDL